MSGRSRKITIYAKAKDGELINIMIESEHIEILSTGDGCAGAEISLIIKE